MDAKQEAENLMPDSLTKWLLWLSIGLSAILYKFYPDLPKSWLPRTEEVYFLTRLLLSGLILLLGSVSLIILLVFHNRKANKALINTKEEIKTASHKMSEISDDNVALKSELDKSNMAFARSRDEIAELQREIKTLKDSLVKSTDDFNYVHKRLLAFHPSFNMDNEQEYEKGFNMSIKETPIKPISKPSPPSNNTKDELIQEALGYDALGRKKDSL